MVSLKMLLHIFFQSNSPHSHWVSYISEGKISLFAFSPLQREVKGQRSAIEQHSGHLAVVQWLALGHYSRLPSQCCPPSLSPPSWIFYLGSALCCWLDWIRVTFINRGRSSFGVQGRPAGTAVSIATEDYNFSGWATEHQLRNAVGLGDISDVVVLE